MLKKYSVINGLMSMFVLLASICRTLLLSTELGPNSYGTLAILLLIIEYGGYGHLGMNYEIDRKLPTLSKNKSAINSYVFRIFNELVLKIAVSIIVLASILIIGYAFSLAVVILILLNVSLLLFSNTLFSIIRALRFYSGYVWLQAVFPFISLAIIAGLSINGRLDISNALIALFIARAVLSVMLMALLVSNFDLKLNLEKLRDFTITLRVRKLALLLFSFNFLFLFLITWERYIGELYLDPIRLGHYMFAIFGIAALRAPFSAMNSIVYPELLRRVDNEVSFILLFKKVLVIEFVLGLVMSVAAYYASALIIEFFFEEYTGSIYFFRQLLIGFPLYVLVICSNMLLLCKEKYIVLIRYLLLSISSTVLLFLFVDVDFIRSQLSIINVLSVGFYFLILSYTVVKEMRRVNSKI